MQDMRDLYKAYAAVHDTTIKEELDNSKDQITGMNLSKMRDEDLIEVAEEIIEGLFQYGKTLDEAYGFVGAVLEEAADNIIGDRKVKITRIAEAFDKAFDTVTDKAERNCEESFLKYRQTKPLTEKWHNKVSHEVGNAKVHASIIHEDRETMKTGLIEMISVAIEDGKVLTEKGMNPGFKAYLEKKKGKKGGDDEGKSSKGGGKPDFLDLDKDGDKKEPMKKASKEMKKEETVLEGGYAMPGGSGRLSDYMQGMSAGTRNTGGTSPSRPTPTPTPAKAMKGGGMVKKDKKTKKEGVEFSQAELDRIKEIVDSWED